MATVSTACRTFPSPWEILSDGAILEHEEGGRCMVHTQICVHTHCPFHGDLPRHCPCSFLTCPPQPRSWWQFQESLSSACLPAQSGCHCPLGVVLVPGRESWGILTWNNLRDDKVYPVRRALSQGSVSLDLSSTDTYARVTKQGWVG